MKVTSIDPIVGEFVNTEYGLFVRLASDNWYIYIYYGETLEPFYSSEEIEVAYQEFKAT